MIRASGRLFDVLSVPLDTEVGRLDSVKSKGPNLHVRIMNGNPHHSAQITKCPVVQN